MKTFSTIAGVLLIPMAVLGQVQNNGVAPIAPQPADMPAPGIFTVTAVTYAALPPNDHYSARLTSTGGGKSFGFLELGTANLEITYDSSNRQITFGNQFVAGAYGLDVLATDGPNYAGLYVDPVKGTRCFNQGPGGFAFDSQPGSYVSACTGVDNGVVVGTAYSTIITRTILTGGESFSTTTGYNQTAFVGSTALGNFGFASGCCSRARGIRGDQIVGDTSCCSGVPLPSDYLSLDSSPAANQNSQAALWLASNPTHQVTLGNIPSMAVATNGVQQGGWAGSHAVLWSGTSASMIDLNPAGYFDSRVTGMTPEFQAGDGWLGGPANSPGAKRHGLPMPVALLME